MTDVIYPAQDIHTWDQNKAFVSGEQTFAGGESQPTGGGGTPTNEQSSQPSTQTQMSGAGVTPGSPSTQPFSSTLTPSAAPIPSRPAPSSPNITIGNYSPNMDIYGAYKNLFAPVTSSVGTGYQKLGELGGKFTQEAGPYRSFAGLGGEDILNKALQPDAQLQGARDLLSANYTGPTGLEGVKQARQTDLEALRAQAEALRGQGSALESPSGIQDLLRQRTPNLTAGEARIESQRLGANPAFQGAREQARTEIGQLYGDLFGAMGQAQAIGQARTAQEADIQAQARGLLTGRQSAITADVQAAIDAATARDKATLAGYQGFQNTGNWQDLLGLPEGANTFDPSAFNTAAVQQLEQGKQVRAGVLAKYPEIADVPLMSLGISRHGRLAYMLDPDWLEANKDRFSPGELEQIRSRAEVRQRDLENAGFARTYGSSAKRPNKYRGVMGTPYGELLSPYFGQGDFQPADIRPYINATGQELPNLSNLSTPEQKRVFNTINDLLGQVEAERWDGTTDPFKAIQIMADLGGYLDQEKATLEARRQNLTEGEKDARKQIDSARRRYEKLKRSKKWQTATRIGIGIGTLGVSEGLRTKYAPYANSLVIGTEKMGGRSMA